MEELKKISQLGAKILPGEPLSQHTTLGIGGPAEWYLEVFNLPQLVALLRLSKEKNIPIFFLGAGSNLLVSDSGISGFVVKMRGDFESISFQADQVRVGAAVFLPHLVKQAADRSWMGIEPLVGVPGTVGGALVMNAGTRDLEIGQVVQSVEVLNSENLLEILPKSSLKFQYRSSSLENQRICFATLQLKQGDKDSIMRTIQDFLNYRLKTQPIGTQNVGSVFRNPQGHFAAELIEKSGLKGKRVGQALISPKHANFILNLGGATASNVKNLIFEIQKIVFEKFGVSLEMEVKIVGR